MLSTKLETERGGWRVVVFCQGTIRQARAAALTLAAHLEQASEGHDWLVHVPGGVLSAGKAGFAVNVQVELSTGSAEETRAARELVLDVLERGFAVPQ